MVAFNQLMDAQPRQDVLRLPAMYGRVGQQGDEGWGFDWGSADGSFYHIAMRRVAESELRKAWRFLADSALFLAPNGRLNHGRDWKKTPIQFRVAVTKVSERKYIV